ncbi:MAG: NAD(P)-dependent oxidoreductase [Clostridiales bacterium]|nr:NAD(P)-dependent oxidoreductase [Clostridiales bacterium]
MKKERNVLITGGNGFIGSHIANKFVDRGYKVSVICRRDHSNNPKFNDNIKANKIEIFRGDIQSFDYEKIADKQFDYIIHTASKVSVYGKMSEFMEINYNGTKKLLEYASQQKQLKCFTYLSSTAVYGYYGYRDLKESDKKIPFNNPYSLSKLETEKLVEEYAKEHHFDYVIARPGNVYGEYDYTSSHEIYSRVKQEKMSICAGGKYLSCFVYAGNLAEAVIHTTENKSAHNTDYNITDGNNETLKEYLTKVAHTFGVRAKFLNFPSFLAKTVATLVEGVYKLFRIKKAPLITRFSIWQNCTDYHFSIDKLLSTGYKKEVEEDEAIKRTTEWYNSTLKKD